MGGLRGRSAWAVCVGGVRGRSAWAVCVHRKCGLYPGVNVNVRSGHLSLRM